MSKNLRHLSGKRPPQVRKKKSKKKVDDDEKTYTDPRFAGPPNTYTA